METRIVIFGRAMIDLLFYKDWNNSVIQSCNDIFRCTMSPNVSELDRHGGKHCSKWKKEM